MKMPMICVVMLALLGMPAMADTQYDRKLEKAVMEIIAGKMGALRGGFDFDAKPGFVVVQQPTVQEQAVPDPMVTGSIARGHLFGSSARDVLLAVERKVSRIIAF